MKLKLVTWEGDLTQFLVYAETDEEAIKLAIESNKEIDVHYGYDEQNDENNPDFYSVEDVEDISFLWAIMERNDCSGIYGNAIVYWG